MPLYVRVSCRVLHSAAVCLSPFTPHRANAALPRVPFELPDGTTVHVEEERYALPELFFNVDPLRSRVIGVEDLQSTIIQSVQACAAETRHDLLGAWRRGLLLGGGVRCCACDSRRVSSFTANVTLIGGCAETPGMAERLQKELNLIAPVLVRVVAPWLPLWLVSITHCLSLCVAVWVCIYVCVYLKGATATVVPSSHRRMAAWMGGSILASMSGFPDMWVSRAEYLESGADVFQRKCP